MGRRNSGNFSRLRDLDIEIAETEKKVVQFERISNALTTFSEPLAEATLEEREELMQLQIHQLIWMPNRIHMAVYETPNKAPEVSTTSGKLQSIVTSGTGGPPSPLCGYGGPPVEL